MNLGRPTTIPDISNVSTPSSLDDEHITAHGYTAPPIPVRSRTAFFVQSVKFCAIIKDLQRSLYPQHSPRNISPDGNGNIAQPTYSDAVRLDKSLIEWYEAVPSFLKSRDPDEDDTFDWIRNVLLCRYVLVCAV